MIVTTVGDRRARLFEAVRKLGHQVTAAVSSADDLDASPTLSPAIVLLGLDGGRQADSLAVDRLRERHPQACLLLIVPAVDKPDRRAITLGADGVIYERELEGTLATAFAALLSGLAVLPRDLAREGRNPTFSSREKQVLAMVVMGLTNIEIAARLFLAESTIKSHLSSAFRKLGVTSRKEAAARILDPESGLGPGILSISGGGPMLSVGEPSRDRSVAAA